MNIDFKQKEADLIAKFDKIKASAAQKEKELAELHEELVRIQGEFRLLKELMATTSEEKGTIVQ